MCPEWAGADVPETPHVDEGRRLPAAARLQGHVSDLDDDLLTAARVTHPTVAWWWGKRRTEQGPGAWCYLCDQLIIGFALNWPMPARAKAAVQLHRTWHANRADRRDAS